MSSSHYLEGLEFKEATPSIAPSIYESLQYTKKWRILLAIGIGLSLIGVCVLAFYLSAEARAAKRNGMWLATNSTDDLPSDEPPTPPWHWRTLEDDQCLITSKLALQCSEELGERVTLIIALSGLGPSQVKQIAALSELVRCGVTATHMVPTYPTSTYTNLYSIATGLYSESHGIVSENMFDPELNLNFTMRDRSSQKSEWWGGEPVWNTASKQGKKSATYFWPGSDVKIQNMSPSYTHAEEAPFEERMKKILDWVRLPEKERPQIILMYHNQPAKTAQLYGIFSDATEEVLLNINSGFDVLLTGLNQADMKVCVNLLVLSDHGTAPSPCDESIFVDEFLGESIPGRVFTGPVGRITLFDGVKSEDVLNKLRCQDVKLRALSLPQIPKRYHYSNNERIGDIVLDTKVGSRIAVEGDNPCLQSEFGYNNLYPSMQSVFIGYGPSFKNGFKTESFRNTEIYSLVCLLAEIKASPNNGTLGGLVHILKPGSWNKTLLEQPDLEFLDEIERPRPQRDENSVVGIRGVDDLVFEETCRCDTSYTVEITTSTPVPFTPVDISTTDEAKPSSTTAKTNAQNINEEAAIVTNKVTTSSVAAVTTSSLVDVTTSSKTEGSSLNTTEINSSIASELSTLNIRSQSMESSTSEIPSFTEFPSASSIVTSVKSSPISLEEVISTSSTIIPISQGEQNNKSISPRNKMGDENNLHLQQNDSSAFPAVNQPSLNPTAGETERIFTKREIKLLVDANSNNKELNGETILSRKSIVGEKVRLRRATVKDDTEQYLISLKTFHAPWGLPMYAAPEVQTDVVNVLLHTSHAIGFPASLNLGLWTSFTMTNEKVEELKQYRPSVPEGIHVDPKDIREDVPIGCWMADPRLSRSSTDQCSRSLQIKLYRDNNVTLRQLYPEELELPKELLTEGFLLSNLAPVRAGYENGGRRAIIAAILKWSKIHQSLNVVHGPIFDHNLDGKRDSVPVVINTIKPLVPSNYFFVITICNKTEIQKGNQAATGPSVALESCPLAQLETFCFVFPNIHEEDNCLMSDQEYLMYHLSSIGDVELLTGLRLFRKFSREAYNKLVIRQPIKLPSF